MADIMEDQEKETNKKIKFDLESVYSKFGGPITSRLLVERISTSQFKLHPQKTQTENEAGVPTDTLFYLLLKASRAAKTKANNKNKRRKRDDVQNTSMKTEVDPECVSHIDDLEISTTIEIFNLDNSTNKSTLEKILLDNSRNTIINEAEATKKLAGLDVHLLLSILQNQMLELKLHSGEESALQGLRLCRNNFAHIEDFPLQNKLKAIRRILQQSLTRLAPKEEHEINCELKKCFDVVDHGKIKGELREELLANAPLMPLVSRSFTWHHQDGSRHPKQKSSSDLCTEIAAYGSKQHNGGILQLQLAGNVCSGRTSALRDIYKHWAVDGSSLNKSFEFVLPLFDLRPPKRRTPHTPDTASASPKDRHDDDGRCWTSDKLVKTLIESSLTRCAPKLLQFYGLQNILQAVQNFEGTDTLALIDSCNGYFDSSVSWKGPCVETHLVNDIYLREFDTINDDLANANSGTQYSAGSDKIRPVAQLLNRSDEEVVAEIKTWDGTNSICCTLYEQFQDKKLMTCPHSLAIFRKVTSTVTNNLEFDVMKALVDDADKWVNDKRQQQSQFQETDTECPNEKMKKEMCRLAYENMISGNNLYDLPSLPFYPPYLIGPKEGPLHFKSRFLEEYLAALYVVKHNTDVAVWKWLRNTPRFKRVFKFVVQLWNKDGTFSQNKKHISNYLAVSFGLYQYFQSPCKNNLNGSRNEERNAKWNKPRDQNCTLKSEGFHRPKEGASFKQWSFLSHVDDACCGDFQVMDIALELLCDFQSWTIEFDKISQSDTIVLKRLFPKVTSYVRGQNCCKMGLIKLHGKATKAQELADVAEALKSLLLPTCRLQIILYYKPKDPLYGCYSDISLPLKTAVDQLMKCELPISSYEGPLMLPSSSLTLAQSASFGMLGKLCVTVYERTALDSLLSSCPPHLLYLNLSVDLAHDTKRSFVHQHRTLAPDAVGAFNPACRVRLALRYHGSFDALTSFRCIPRIHVLRIHGVYHSDGFPNVKGLNVDCLFVKFVKKCLISETSCPSQSKIPATPVSGGGTQQTRSDEESLQNTRDSNAPGSSSGKGQNWYYNLLLSLVKCMPSVSRLLLCQLPRDFSHQLSQFVQDIMENLKDLRRLVVQNSFVSVTEAMLTLDVVQSKKSLPAADGEMSASGRTESAADVTYPLRPRLSKEKRDEYCKQKPLGFELMFIEVYDVLPSDQLPPVVCNTGDSSSSITTATTDKQNRLRNAFLSSDDWYFSDLPSFIESVYTCRLTHFCYEGYRGFLFNNTVNCNNSSPSHHCDAGALSHGRPFQVMLNPARDCRLHLDLLELNDKMLERMANCVESGNSLRLSTLAAAQYLHVRCTCLAAEGFSLLAEMLKDEKRKRLCNSNSLSNITSEDKFVDPFHVTVISTLDQSRFRSGKRNPELVKEQFLKEECNQLQNIYLPQATYLSYAYFELIDPVISTKTLCYVRKTHQGTVNAEVYK